MQFKEGTTVFTADGEKVGDIERFVVDPRERKVAGLIVRKGFLFTEDKVVPIDKINRANEERVILRSDVDPSEDLPPFEQTHYVMLNTTDLQSDYPTGSVAPLYYYPPPDIAVWYGGVHAPPDLAVEERNIPEDTVPLKTGADVISSDGDKVGDVERIFTDSDTGRITHFSITRGVLFQEERLIPVGWVKHIREDKVHLAVNSKTLEKLRDM